MSNTEYGRTHIKLFTNCHVSWDTLYPSFCFLILFPFARTTHQSTVSSSLLIRLRFPGGRRCKIRHCYLYMESHLHLRLQSFQHPILTHCYIHTLVTFSLQIGWSYVSGWTTFYLKIYSYFKKIYEKFIRTNFTPNNARFINSFTEIACKARTNNYISTSPLLIIYPEFSVYLSLANYISRVQCLPFYCWLYIQSLVSASPLLIIYAEFSVYLFIAGDISRAQCLPLPC